ncbi:response regulator transcription factor [bacterium]|nr:response regulator transcription factor [bacterium]
MEPIKVFLVDDNNNFRERVKALVDEQEDMRIVGEAPDADLLLKEVPESRADMVLIDVSMPGMNGLDATRMLRASMPELKIIMVSVYDIDEYKEAALANGAGAYLVKKDIMTALIPTIRKVISG